MKGLLIKDAALMKQRMKIFLLMLVWGVGMIFIMEDSSFVIAWLTMIAMIASLSTIAYDEYDNCLPFLMSLPITRKAYVLEKYLFTFLFGALFWVISILITMIFSGFVNISFTAQDLSQAGIILMVTLLVPAISIPPQLKWGAEKGRMVMMVLFIMVAAIAMIAGKAGLNQMVSSLEKIPVTKAAVICFVSAAVVTAGSILLSIRIVQKKEY